MSRGGSRGFQKPSPRAVPGFCGQSVWTWVLCFHQRYAVAERIAPERDEVMLVLGRHTVTYVHVICQRSCPWENPSSPSSEGGLFRIASQGLNVHYLGCRDREPSARVSHCCFPTWKLRPVPPGVAGERFVHTCFSSALFPSARRLVLILARSTAPCAGCFSRASSNSASHSLLSACCSTSYPVFHFFPFIVFLVPPTPVMYCSESL